MTENPSEEVEQEGPFGNVTEAVTHPTEDRTESSPESGSDSES